MVDYINFALLLQVRRLKNVIFVFDFRIINGIYIVTLAL